MRADLFSRIFFILYCIEAGVFLLWAPWTPFWERAVFGLPFPGLAEIDAFLVEPLTRGAVSGFGLVHLVWGIHDLRSLLLSPGARGDAASTS